MRKQNHLPREAAVKDRAEAEIQHYSSQTPPSSHQFLLGRIFPITRTGYDLCHRCTSNVHIKIAMSSSPIWWSSLTLNFQKVKLIICLLIT